MILTKKLATLKTNNSIILSKKSIISMLEGENFFPIDSIYTFVSKISFLNQESLKYIRLIIPSIIILLPSIFLSVVPFNYDSDNKIVTWFGVIIGKGYEISLLSTLHSFVLLAWILMIIYLAIFLFFPLGNSFLLSHQLWLRLTNCEPYTVSIYRVIYIIVYAIFVSALVGVWGLITSIFNQISVGELLYEALAIFSYIISVGGFIVFVLTLANQFKPIIATKFCFLMSIMTLFYPVIFLLIYGWSYFQNPQSQWLKYIPLSLPMSIMKSIENYQIHFFVTMTVGFMLLGLSILISWLGGRNRLKLNFSSLFN